MLVRPRGLAGVLVASAIVDVELCGDGLASDAGAVVVVDDVSITVVDVVAIVVAAMLEA